MLFRLSEVTKSYGGNQILKAVSFQVNPNEKVGLVGRNGAGKTTVFRILTGQEAPDEGQVVKMNGLKLGLLEQHVDFGKAEDVHTAALSAFAEIHDIEAEMRRLEQQMVTDHSDAVLERYADLQNAFELADGFSYAARAESVLLGMGFKSESWKDDVRTLSGGQKNRLGMVRLLLSNADVLLLDEPTNHLDVNAVEWLEEFLSEYAGSYVVISHDRYFLDRVTNRVIEMDRGLAVTYKGNYSDYLVERELRREQQMREYENQQAYINKTQEFIRRNLEGQKTKQAKSRRTMLAKMDRIEAVHSEKSGGNFGLKKVERSGNNVLTVEELSIGYEDVPLATGLNFGVQRGETLGIIGGNGTGKSTLIKTLLGSLRAIDGEMRWGTKTNIGYYSQNLEGLTGNNEVIQELRTIAPLADNGTLRGFLANFLFFGDDVFKPVSALSGGEKGRLALAKLIYSQKNVLVLDEPTNHLDIPARESLENALDQYDGTIIVVSHDRFFLDKIADQILAFDTDGTVSSYFGNYTAYHDWRNSRRTSIEPTQPVAAAPKTAVERNNGADLSKNQRTQIEARINEIEKEISSLDAETSKLNEKASDPTIAADYSKLSEVTGRLSSIEKTTADLYSEWDDLTAKLQ